MPKSATTGLLLAWLTWFAAPAGASGIWVIVSGDAPLDHLSRAEVSGLFLGLGENSLGLKPFDRADRELFAGFYRAVNGRSVASVRAHRARQVFTGRGRPPAKLSGHEIDGALRRDPPFVTYVTAGHVPEGAKVLLRLDEEGFR